MESLSGRIKEVQMIHTANRRDLAGQFLREKRLAMGMTQKQIADLMNWQNANYVSQVELGRTTVSSGKLIQLERVYSLNRKEFAQLIKWLYPKEMTVITYLSEIKWKDT
jgi:transcriptional regulator with XRE-family HTH domain